MFSEKIIFEIGKFILMVFLSIFLLFNRHNMFDILFNVSEENINNISYTYVSTTIANKEVMNGYLGSNKCYLRTSDKDNNIYVVAVDKESYIKCEKDMKAYLVINNRVENVIKGFLNKNKAIEHMQNQADICRTVINKLD